LSRLLGASFPKPPGFPIARSPPSSPRLPHSTSSTIGTFTGVTPASFEPRSITGRTPKSALRIREVLRAPIPSLTTAMKSVGLSHGHRVAKLPGKPPEARSCSLETAFVVSTDLTFEPTPRCAGPLPCPRPERLQSSLSPATKGMSVAEVNAVFTCHDPWFLSQDSGRSRASKGSRQGPARRIIAKRPHRTGRAMGFFPQAPWPAGRPDESWCAGFATRSTCVPSYKRIEHLPPPSSRQDALPLFHLRTRLPGAQRRRIASPASCAREGIILGGGPNRDRPGLELRLFAAARPTAWRTSALIDHGQLQPGKPFSTIRHVRDRLYFEPLDRRSIVLEIQSTRSKSAGTLEGRESSSFGRPRTPLKARPHAPQREYPDPRHQPEMIDLA